MTKRHSETDLDHYRRGHSCDGCDNDYTLSGIRGMVGAPMGLRRKEKTASKRMSAAQKRKFIALAGLFFYALFL